MTTSRPYELFARFAANGSIAGVSVRTITTINGRDYENDPQPLSGASDPAFAAFASQFAAAAVAERDASQTSLATMTADRDAQKALADTVPGLQQQLATVTAEKSGLQAEVDRLTALVPPPVDPNAVPAFVTALQGRLALKRSGLLQTVETAIITANGETQIWWEYAAEWHRNNAVLLALGASLGLTSEQIDELFRVAGSIN